ncbi:protein FANTASTIC FOUR 1-like [Neovison vison]|uniref:protein FANTASTIC FOUR 1-like n=1 Tax=Neovison vison TaxID=452646 RepID=UPI001CF0D0F2|nr:protein FANTASTIC FOUR 1-like [Neogale vison]
MEAMQAEAAARVQALVKERVQWRLEPGDRWVSSFLPCLSRSLLGASLSSGPWESWESSEVLSPEPEEEEEKEEEEEEEEEEGEEVKS